MVSKLKVVSACFGILFLLPVSAFAHEHKCSIYLAASDVDSRDAESTAYELKAAEYYLDWHQAADERIVIASQIAGWYVPAFDGVVMNEEGQKIANLSIKGIRVSDPAGHAIPATRVANKMYRLLYHAEKMVREWGEEERWVRGFKYSRAQIDQILKDNAHIDMKHLRKKKIFLDQSADLFSVPYSRTGIKTRIIVVVTDMQGNLEDLDLNQLPQKTIHRILRDGSGPIESITILAKNRVWDFRHSH